MRHILLGTVTVAALAFGAGAMAQTPVPNASGSQTTNPATIGNTANAPNTMSGGSMSAQPMKMKKRSATHTTGSVRARGASSSTPAPVPNASGSQTTNPATIGNTANPPAMKR